MKLWKMIPLLTLIALLTACASPAPSLNGTQWRLISLNGQPVPGQLVPTLAFRDGNAGGKAGCNGYGSEYEQNGDKITFGHALSTMMYCEGAMEVEISFLQTLTEIDRFTVEGDTLTLFDGTGAARLVFSRFG